MAIAFATFYPRIGKLAEAAIHANTYRGTTLPADVVEIAGVYSGDPDLVAQLYSQQVFQQSTVGALPQYLRSLAIDTLYDIVDDDRPLLTGSVGDYLTELVRQQITASIELDDSPATVGTITAGASNLGDAKFVISSKDVYGVASNSIYAETVRFDCVSSLQQGAAEWAETFSVYGIAKVSDSLSSDWPGGSGSSATLSLIDPAVDGIVTNATFEAFTLHTPDDWTITEGVTEINTEFSTFTPRGETRCLELIGDGSTVVTLTQSISLQPNTRYGITVKCAARTNNMNVDTLTFGVYNAATETAVTDDAGGAMYLSTNTAGIVADYNGASVTADAGTDAFTKTAHTLVNGDMVVFGGTAVPGGLVADTVYYVVNKATNTFQVAATSGGTAINLTSAGTSVTFTHVKWVTLTSSFVTPTVLPDDTELWIATDNTLDGKVLISHLCISPMTEMYQGGYCTIGFSGIVHNAITDRYTSAITVSGVNTSMVRWMERFFEVSRYGLSLRTAASPTAGYDDATLIVVP